MHKANSNITENAAGRRSVSIILPFYNEAAGIEAFTAALLRDIAPLEERYAFELLFVDDGSSDASAAIVAAMSRADERLRLLRLSRNFGKEAAVLAGLDHAGGDCAIIMDSDGQHPASALPRMLEMWEEGYDDVYGRRTELNMGATRNIMSRLYHSLLASLSGLDFGGSVGDFRLMSRPCIDAFRTMREVVRYNKGIYARLGFRKGAVDFATEPRRSGVSKMRPSKLLALASAGITGHSVKPLRLPLWLGVAFIMASIAAAIVALTGAGAAWWLGALVALTGGIIMLCLGIMGEYIGAIMAETKGRPPYILRE